MFGTQVLDRVNYTSCACVADTPERYEREAVHAAFKYFDRRWLRACREGAANSYMFKLRANQIWAYLGKAA